MSKSELGNFVIARRLLLNLNQSRLGALCGLRQNDISAIETGRRKYLKDDMIARLASALQCSEKELRERIPTKSSDQVKTEFGALIVSRCKVLDITIESLASKMGRTVTWTKELLFSKRNHARYKTLGLLAKALNLNPSDLSKFSIKTRKETTNKLGELVRARRIELGLSNQEFAERMGVTRQFVNLIELGRVGLSRNNERINKIAKTLKLDESKLKTVRPKRKLKSTSVEDPIVKSIIEKRLELHLTQHEVATLAGINATKLCAIERGRMHADPTILSKLRRVLNC